MPTSYIGTHDGAGDPIFALERELAVLDESVTDFRSVALHCWCEMSRDSVSLPCWQRRTDARGLRAGRPHLAGPDQSTLGVEQVIEIAEQTRRYRDAVLATNLLRRVAVKSWWVGRSMESQELLAAAAGAVR
jgi:hypothetical protein